MIFLLGLVDAFTHEMLLFAAIGFLIGGIDDLSIDLIHGWHLLRDRISGPRRPRIALSQLPVPADPSMIAVFVPAWDESQVIGPMLSGALARFDHSRYRIYVGVYPNDPATMGAVTAIARTDLRVRPVVVDRPGPTTKAHCLNQLWAALLADQAAGNDPADLIVLHDAEDWVHPGELAVYAHHIGRYDVVQIPVLPLVHPASPFVSGHYADEFAEAHLKSLPVRERLGAGLPLAGVGCAIRFSMLVAIATARGGKPFDEDSLTEDYELGLAIHRLGGRGALVRMAERPGGPLVAVRAYFPDTIDAAVRQKARWITGIALAGWDRTGWSRARQWQDHWMRMRDRRTLIAVMVLAAAYLALLGWGVGRVGHWLAGVPVPATDPWIAWLIPINAVLLGWRLIVRAIHVRAHYGWGQALLSAPRAIVGNFIALLATRRALFAYFRLLRGARLHWDKTAHHFPVAPDRATR
ncbi:glycosyl transferase family protein [Sphingomonas sp. FW199]|uniref:glycosyl transferase family protein n=1 Tax=Sphingomonas sp. FW199 TaxID=3400217 RepID=UPI003CED615B